METTTNYESLDAIVVRSPMAFGGEAKDQDRVSWSPACATAGVFDGLTDSINSAEAAAQAAAFCPVLFRDGSDVDASLRALAHMLMVRREEARRENLRPPVGTSPEMAAMLQKVAREKLSQSFQTTLVAAAVRPGPEAWDVHVLDIGDSAFFSFAGDGSLLCSSIQTPAPGDTEKVPDTAGLGVRYGDELLAKVMCPASNNPALAQLAGLNEENAAAWLLCMPLDRCGGVQVSGQQGPRHPHVWLRPDEVLAVPRYLVEVPRDPALRGYCRLLYSRAVRFARQPAEPPSRPRIKSPATAALPDHYFTGNWTQFHERVPADGSIVLASDGFYTCFATPVEMWQWLKDNQTALRNDPAREAALQDLHHRLHRASGDDDISFVWVFARAGEDVHNQHPVEEQ